MMQIRHPIQEKKFGQSPLSRYKDMKVIAKGAYGIVYKAFDSVEKEYVAIKQIIFQMETQGFPSTSLREISFLREIASDYIVKYRLHKQIFRLLDVAIDQKKLYLIFEFLQKDLNGHLKGLGDQFLSPQQVKKGMYQLLMGVNLCVSKRIIHRDLKPANILIDKDHNFKIADFGLARSYSVPVRPYSKEVVTLWYRAPQVLLGSLEYSTPIDMWAVGCIFAEIVTKKILFQGETDANQLNRIFRIMGTPTQETWPGVTKLSLYKTDFPNWPKNDMKAVVKNLNLDQQGLDLLYVLLYYKQKLLEYNPSKRISAKDALTHPYFDDYLHQ